MNVNAKIIKLLQIPDNEISSILISSVGLPKNESDTMLNNWILEKIILNYDMVKDNIDIISFININGNPSISEDCYLRDAIYKFLTVNDFNFSIFESIEEMTDQYSKELYYLIIAQLNVPPSYKRVACLNLLQTNKYHVLIISVLESIILSNINIIDKYYCLSLLSFIYKSKNVKCRYKFDNFLYDDEHNLERHYEQFISISFENELIAPENVENLKRLGKISLECHHFYFFKENNIIYSKLNGNNFPVKITGPDFVEYTDLDYMCMIGFLCKIPNETSMYFTENISRRLIVKIGIFLCENETLPAIHIIMNLISDANLDFNIRLMISKSLKSLTNKQYIETAISILKDQTVLMNQEELYLFKKLL